VLVLTHVGPVLMQHVMHHAKSKNLKLAAYHRFPNETKAVWIDFQSTFPRRKIIVFEQNFSYFGILVVKEHYLPSPQPPPSVPANACCLKPSSRAFTVTPPLGLDDRGGGSFLNTHDAALCSARSWCHSCRVP
jgi:hypothetical protein